MNQIINPVKSIRTQRIQLLNTEVVFNIPANTESLDIQSVNVNPAGDNSYGVQFEFYTNQGEPETGNRNTVFQGSGLNIPVGNIRTIYFIANNASATSFLDITLYLYP